MTMKQKEVVRGMEVIYNGIDCVVLEPLINSVKIQFFVDGNLKQTHVSYDALEVKKTD